MKMIVINSIKINKLTDFIKLQKLISVLFEI